MQDLRPVTPKNLNPLARELLESLAGHPEAAEIVLGGGVALSHYLEYRPTVDVNAWWRTKLSPGTAEMIRHVMERLAANHGLTLRVRQWGETESYELLAGSQKKFSFQISIRDRFLSGLHPCDWTPVMIEDFRDNLASKLRALVDRGAPRDFTDVYQVCRRGLVSPEECWRLHESKNPNQPVSEARRKVLCFLHAIEVRRPLDRIPPAERSNAALVRAWYHDTFCADSP